MGVWLSGDVKHMWDGSDLEGAVFSQQGTFKNANKSKFRPDNPPEN